MEKVIRKFGFLKTTAIGGLLFLLPLIVIGALIGQVVPIVMTIAEVLGEWIPVRSARGISLLILLAIAVLVCLCFVAGLAARRSIGKKFSGVIEKHLLMLFPRYAIFKEQMAGTIGGDENRPTMKPVLVRFDDASRVAFETDRAQGDLVAVYMPGSPDPWSGHVVYVPLKQIQPLDLPFGEAVGMCEQLGRGSAQTIADRPTRKHTASSDAPTD